MKFAKMVVVAMVAAVFASSLAIAEGIQCYQPEAAKDCLPQIYLDCPIPGDQNDRFYCVPEEPNNVVFNICCCDQNEFFARGQEIAIRYRIVDVDQGVYFAEFTDQDILANRILGKIDPTLGWGFGCPGEVDPLTGLAVAEPNFSCWDINGHYDYEGIVYSGDVLWNVLMDPIYPAAEGFAAWDGFTYKRKNGTVTTNAGIQVPYDVDVDADFDSIPEVDWDGDGVVDNQFGCYHFPRADYDNCSYGCEVGAANQVVEMWTSRTAATTPIGSVVAGYTMKDFGVFVDSETCWWVLNIPYLVMNWDEAVNHQNETVEVAIELFHVPDGSIASICDDAQLICYCIVPVAVICDPDQESYELRSRRLMYPYVKVGDAEGWLSGIAVSNIDVAMAPSQMEAQFTFIDNAGKVFSYTMGHENTIPFDAQVFEASMDSMVALFGWEDVASGAGVLRVDTNFAADGYQFNLLMMAGDIFGSGFLPRVNEKEYWYHVIGGDENTVEFDDGDDNELTEGDWDFDFYIF